MVRYTVPRQWLGDGARAWDHSHRRSLGIADYSGLKKRNHAEQKLKVAMG